MKKKISLILAVIIVIACLFSFAACNESKTPAYTIVVGASSTPHAEILEEVKDVLAQWGWTLEIKTFADYVLPNTGVEGGELDANYFQHITYMNQFNVENKTHLVNVFAVHYEPFGIYAGTANSLGSINSSSTVVIPNDTTNCARALLLLQEQKLIKLAEGKGLNATKNDIIDAESVIKKANVFELEAKNIASARSEKSIVVLNGNYAQQAGLKVNDALAVESTTGTAAVAYANVIAVKAGNENNPKTIALINALKSQQVIDFIASKYTDGSVQTVFELGK